MSLSEKQNIWHFIQDNMKEVEKLIGQKEYNLSMVKSRQTLEQMVKYLYKNISDDDNIDLIDMIDELYTNQLISKTSLENYHKIRMIGNKATHNNDNNSYSANNAFSLLSREVTAFSNDQYVKQGRRVKKNHAPSTSSSPIKRKKPLSKRQRQELDIQKAITFAIIPLLILLVILMFRYCSKKKANETLAPSTSISETNVDIEETSEEIIAEEPSTQIYITTNNLNIRSAPSTDSSKITTVAKGTELTFIKEYDAEWSIISYNDAQAYVASKYIRLKD